MNDLNHKYTALILTIVSNIVAAHKNYFQFVYCGMTHISIRSASLLTFFAAIAWLSFTPQQTPICRDLRKGRFHVYNANREHIVINRNDSVQQEINLSTKDTIYWRLKWKTECSFDVQYVGSSKKNAAIDAIRQDVGINYEILTITNQYYIGRTTMVSMGRSDSRFTDTTWLKERSRP